MTNKIRIKSDICILFTKLFSKKLKNFNIPMNGSEKIKTKNINDIV